MKIEIRKRDAGGFLWRVWHNSRAHGWGITKTREAAHEAANVEVARLRRLGYLDWGLEPEPVEKSTPAPAAPDVPEWLKPRAS